MPSFPRKREPSVFVPAFAFESGKSLGSRFRGNDAREAITLPTPTPTPTSIPTPDTRLPTPDHAHYPPRSPPAHHRAPRDLPRRNGRPDALGHAWRSLAGDDRGD